MVKHSITAMFQTLRLVLLLSLSGCATPYTSNGLLGGFSDRQLSVDTYRVAFRGNGFTQDERASDFLMLRCAELTLQHGGKFFRLVGASDTSQNGAVVIPQTATTTGTYGNGYYSAQTQTSPGFIAPLHFPHQTAIIQFRQSKELATDIDAELVSQSVKAQYGIK